MYIRKFRITKLTFRLLLFVFLYNSIGYFLIFKCIQSSIKEQVAQDMLQQPFTKSLKAIVFYKHDLKKINWVKKKKELRYNGGMYDVVKTIETKDSIIYYCMNDEKEDHLFNELEDHVTTHVILPATNDSSKKTALEPIKLYFTDENRFSFALSILFLRPFSIFNVYLPVYIELDVPPPQFT